jgi:hypothetical protein
MLFDRLISFIKENALLCLRFPSLKDLFWLIAGLVNVARKRVVKRLRYGPSLAAPRLSKRHGRKMPYCTDPYDDRHIRIHGYSCMNCHTSYSWPALDVEKYLLIGDSIVKFINRGKHLRVMAFPGAKAHTIYEKICKKEIEVAGYDLIFVEIGTNDVSNLELTPSMITCGIMNLMDTIHVYNPEARLVVLGMLVRPRDEGTAIEYRRKLVNVMVKGDCKRYGIHFTRAWRSLMNGLSIKPRVYAQDGLHLNRFGARFLYRTIEGNIRTLSGLMKL